MKILFSCLSKSWGGMEMLTLTQMQQLLDRKITVELLCIDGSRMQEEAGKKGYRTHTVFASGSVNPRAISKLITILKENKFDLIHSHASGDLWSIVPALKIGRLNIPLLLTKHVGSRIVKRDFLHRRVYNRVNAAIAISGVIRSNLIETTPLPEEKIFLLHNGIDVNRFDPVKVDRQSARKEFGLSEDEIVIGMMGRFSPGKGHEEFLNAAKILNEKSNRLKFVVVGEASFGEEAYRDKIKKLSSDLGLANIIFTGYIRDTPKILAAMDVFVFPSHAESFGLALTEAMAMELPSVSSDSDGVLEITVDKETGLLFKNKNYADLAEKAAELISSKELSKKFGETARQRVLENFNLSTQTEKLIDIYSAQISGN